jgi:methylenetetrahydrofolate dehydrogenase (NADP+)/methenyltetrahydrofolate cyclohydrolase
MATIIDGKLISKKIKDQLIDKVKELNKKLDHELSLAVILVGNNPASQVYVKNKIKSAEYVGIKSLSYCLPENTSQKELEDLVIKLSNDNSVDGILVQLPLPKGLNEKKVLSLIPLNKDVDGFTANNVGNLLLGNDCIVSCTPKAVITLLKEYNVELKGKHAVVVGRSNIVGKPVALLLLQEDCTVSICHSRTKNLKEMCLQADIIIAAVGKTHLIKGDMVKDGAVIIDVGINRTENGLKGDVDFDNALLKASYITPVPGGVGPMTIAMLMENTYHCALMRALNG